MSSKVGETRKLMGTGLQSKSTSKLQHPSGTTIVFRACVQARAYSSWEETRGRQNTKRAGMFEVHITFIVSKKRENRLINSTIVFLIIFCQFHKNPHQPWPGLAPQMATGHEPGSRRRAQCFSLPETCRFGNEKLGAPAEQNLTRTTSQPL